MTILRIRQDPPSGGTYPIRLTLKRDGQPEREADARIEFALSVQEQEDLRWYLEDYLQQSDPVSAVPAEQVQAVMRERGEELYAKVLAANRGTQALWFSVRDELSDLRVEVVTGVAEAASIPWELMRDPEMDSPVSLRVRSFVRVQSNTSIAFVPVPPSPDGRIRLLYAVCRPGGSSDVELRAVANRLLQDLGDARDRFEIKALRPPTFEQLQLELADAKEAGRPYHIVHFDGHGVYADLSDLKLADWLADGSTVTLGAGMSGRHGYLLFEHPGDDKVRAVGGVALGQLLKDNGVPVLVLNACHSAMHQTTEGSKAAEGVHDEIRAIGSLAQQVVDQGIPAVLGMRYSVYVVTAAQYIGQLYASLAKGRSFGQAATEGRKHLRLNPERWVGLQPRPLQDWLVPVVYEAAPIELFAAGQTGPPGHGPDRDPVQRNRTLLRHVPEEGFIGRDETLLALDRAFDKHRIVLLHAYAGQGKTTTTVEFARWYALTGGLGEEPVVLLSSFETHLDLEDLLNQIGQVFASTLEAHNVHWLAINDLEERRNLVIQVLRQIPVLWLWDNVETVAGFPVTKDSHWTAAEQGDLRDFLKQIKLDAATKVKILLTSRHDEQKWLGRLPHRVAMPHMSNSDAAKLALKLGEERHLKRAAIADWQPMLDYCAGNPYTLRVLVGQAVRTGIQGKDEIRAFVEAIREGEQEIQDADVSEGRDRSLGASLDYGFRHAFKDDELPIIALLHLFQGAVYVRALEIMGQPAEYRLPELEGKSGEYLRGLLERATDSGLLTERYSMWFDIHPALPWFLRSLFVRHYDGQAGRSTSEAAVRSWTEAISQLSNHYFGEFVEGDSRVRILLDFEQANVLHARRIARRNQWWSSVTLCMQGLLVLYRYQGRTAEWARLVEEIRPDYCTADDYPLPGRENEYGLVMGYRINLAHDHERDRAKAALLEQRLNEFERMQAAAVLAMPIDAPLDSVQRKMLRDLAVSSIALAQTIEDDNDAGCVTKIQEAISLLRRIGDKVSEATAEAALGKAYLNVQSIRNLDAAEAALQRSMTLLNQNDILGRCRLIREIGHVHLERFRDAQGRAEPPEAQSRHADAAEAHYHMAVEVCPDDALAELGPTHASLGLLYWQMRRNEAALESYKLSAQYAERIDDRFAAGRSRMYIAAIYADGVDQKGPLPQQRTSFLRARAYAEAALRDFHNYQGRTAQEKTEARELIDWIDECLAKLPAPDENSTTQPAEH